VVNAEVPLRHDLLKVTIREGVSEVPTDAQEDDHVFEMPPAEQCRPFSGHDMPYQISSIASATESSGTTNFTHGSTIVAGLILTAATGVLAGLMILNLQQRYRSIRLRGINKSNPHVTSFSQLSKIPK
jgi:hypothetical protein